MLRALAAARLKAEPVEHLLQPTALVHEAFIRLAAQTRAVIDRQDQFLAIASQAMRRILVDDARRRLALKRTAPELTPAQTGAEFDGLDLAALNEALDRLALLHARQARVVELRFFGGLNVTQTARVLGISEPTVKNDWRFARAWLRDQMENQGSPA
jgi:RNA polymerase sigma factor (TIGR02999 family)